MSNITPAPNTGKSSSTPDLLNKALEYALRGWYVLPLHNPIGGGCSCGKSTCKNVGKHPRTPRGLKDASVNPAIIEGWWKKWPDANIGIATGLVSGIFVVDVDSAEGEASLAALGEVTETLRVLTGRTEQDGSRPGFHLYFIHPTGAAIVNRVRLTEGVDVRGTGGYVVAPPSLHRSGLRYEWIAVNTTVATAPAWLTTTLSKPSGGALPTPSGTVLFEGERNDRLFRWACRWRRRGMERDQIESKLLAENERNCKPPLDREEVRKIAASAAKYDPGGPDPLNMAWAEVQREEHHWIYNKLLSLIRHLHTASRGQPIILPVERIAELMGCDRTMIGRHRTRAVSDGFLELTERYIPHKRANIYRVLRLP